MTEPNPPQESLAENLQFDEAEYHDGQVAGKTCVYCNQAIASVYYEHNGQILCENCRRAIEVQLKGGSGIARFARALVFGLGAGVVGFAIYFGVMKLANMEIGLISVLVGYLVGNAVRKGSRGRGGWVYQLLAIFLTYTAIGASYTAMFLTAQDEAKQQQPAKKNAPAPAAVGPGALNPAKPAPHPADKAIAKDPERVVVKPDLKAQPANQAPEAPIRNPLFWVLLSIVFVYSLPIIVGIQQPIGLLIVAFAIWEAWKFNVRPRIVFNGPFRVSEIGSSPKPEGESSDE